MKSGRRDTRKETETQDKKLTQPNFKNKETQLPVRKQIFMG